MSTKQSHERRRRKHIQLCRVAATLWDAPKPLDEVADRFYSYLRAVGFFRRPERLARNRIAYIHRQLQTLMALGWVILEQEHYALTPLGREAVNQRLSELSDLGVSFRQFLQPQTVSKVTLGFHLGLSILKLTAGMLSGSVGLLNDAADTFLDGFSSLLVYLALRFDQERLVNIVLVVFMVGTGLFTFYQAIQRFFVPVVPEVDGFTFMATILSGVICLLLWVYQLWVGLRSGRLALISQSVDSRNHVIVAAGVMVGLIAALLKFSLLDTLVGLTVAILILRSAFELTIEVIRSLGEEGVDLSRYEFGLAKSYETFRQTQLRDWMLYLVKEQGVRTRTELVARARQALDFNTIPALRAWGITQQQPQNDEIIEHCIAELLTRGWLSGEDCLHITPAGRRHIGQWT
ncbi:MAG: cation transporter [Cyanobacteria bacterium J06629_9]